MITFHGAVARLKEYGKPFDDSLSRELIGLGQGPWAFTLLEAPARDDLAAGRPVV
jgi:hypothetical protein